MPFLPDHNHLWMPFAAWQDTIDYPPLVIERGEGIYLYDREGNSYIDAIGSWWVSLFGHNHPSITAAVKKQLNGLEHVMMAGLIAEPTLRLSNLLSALLPPQLSRIFFSDNGSTAVEVALKIALQYHAQCGTNRTSFIALGGGYHGDTLGAMSVGDIPTYHALFHDRFKKGIFTNSPNCYRCPCGKEAASCSAECMDSLEMLLMEHHKTVAACIFEPMVQGAVGMRIYPPKVLERIFALCKQYAVLTIADEVAMGFGRTGKLFACEHAHATPDILCLAKGLTGGYLPLSATIVQEEIFSVFKGDAFANRTFQHGHTFTGNPLAAAAACATLTLIQENNIPASLATKTDYFTKQLQTFNKHAIVGDIRSIGLIGALELVADRTTKAALPAEKRIAFTICRKAMAQGLILRPLGDVLYFVPAYTITEQEIDRMFAITHEVIKDTVDEQISPL